MKKLKIESLEQAKPTGVAFYHTAEAEPWKERYFEWTAFPMATEFQTGRIVSGMLCSWHHTPVFEELEYHADREALYFFEGSAIILFCDIRDGKAVMDSAQLVRIPEGTLIAIDGGKGHFVAVAEGERYRAVVYSPEQGSPRVPLAEPVAAL